MQTILIPPTPELHKHPQPMHLLLQHLCDTKAYREYYIQRRMAGEYLILDNSAYELGESLHMGELLHNAARLNVQEIVAPDVLGNAQETILRTEFFLLALRNTTDRFKGGAPRVMLVPQGESFTEWCGCLEHLLEKHYFYFPQQIPVVGLARRYEDMDTQAGRGLFGFVNYLQSKRQYRELEAHLLGWGRDVWALGAIAHLHPWIRSVDSAKPFHLAMSGIRLDPRMPKVEYVKRPQDYFERKLSPSEGVTAEVNISFFKAMAAGVLHR